MESKKKEVRSDCVWSQRSLREWGVGERDNRGQKGQGLIHMDEYGLVTGQRVCLMYLKVPKESVS